MKQNRFKIFASFTLLLAVIIAAGSCRKLSYDENESFTHCYCVYFTSPGVERREDIRMHTTSERYAVGNCMAIEEDLGAKYGYRNVECSIY